MNTYGKKLINLCKTTGLQIVNGRKGKGRQSNITFYNAHATSTIDYLLTDVNSSNTIVDFCTGYFNTFSDHAPLAFSIKSYGGVEGPD